MSKNIVHLMAGVALVVSQVNPAYAQLVPDAPPNSTPAPVGVQVDDTPARSGATRDPGVVMLADLVPDGGHPRAARPSTIAEDTPIMTREEFLRRYPQAGIAAYNRIVDSNYNLCQNILEFLQGIMQLDVQFANADEEYAALQQIYDLLPEDVRRSTRIMQISQVGAAGALCVLSAGLYCIAAIFTAIGSLFSSRTNRRLQLANIRLSIANIRVTRLNIGSNRLTLRLDAFWLGLIDPACRRLHPQMWAVLDTPASTILRAPPSYQLGDHARGSRADDVGVRYRDR